jgi:hypothetical protein
MYTTVRRYKMGAGTAAEVAKKVEDEFIARISDIPGFHHYQVIDAGDGVVASVSSFDDLPGAQESDRRAAEWVPDALAEFEFSPAEITEGEVLLHADN